MRTPQEWRDPAPEELEIRWAEEIDLYDRQAREMTLNERMNTLDEIITELTAMGVTDAAAHCKDAYVAIGTLIPGLVEDPEQLKFF